MRSYDVMVLSQAEETPVVEALFLLGITPLLRGTIGDAIKAASRKPIDAVVVDLEHCSEDAVELLLNVRDVAPDVPAILVGDVSGEAMAELIGSLVHTTFLKPLPDPERMAPILDAVLDALVSRGALDGGKTS